MAEKFEEISELVIAYITKQLSEEQERSLNAWVEESPANKAWLEQWDDLSWIAHELEEYDEPDVDEALREFYILLEQEGYSKKTAPAPKPKLRPLWKNIAAAAVVIGMLIGAWKVYDLYTSRPSPSITTTDNNKKPVDSINREHITLALTDSTNLIIDDLPNGVIYSQAGVEVVKQDSVLQYTRVSQDVAALNVMHTISAGKGKRLRVILTDSSSVWLNAASSIRFPLVYQPERRWVETTGEVLVQVSANKARPFYVMADKTEVEAVGTLFNVNTYGPTKKVALLEGKINIKNGNVDTTLSVPGETALLDKDSKIKVFHADDLEKVTAWQKGEFDFRKDPFAEALLEIGRWYAVDIKYIDTPATIISESSFSRNTPLLSAIKLLKQVDSNLNILKQGNVLVVSYNKKN